MHRRRRRGPSGGAQQLGEEGEAVGVGPLEVVDRDDQIARFADAAEEGAHRGEEARPVIGGRRVSGEPGGGGHEQREDGEHGGRERHVVHAEGRALLGQQRAEAAREVVDDAVHGLVRDALAVVAAAGEREDGGVEAVEEPAHERGLPEAGLALDDDGARGAGAHLREGLLERRELAPAPEEAEGGGTRGHARDVGHGEAREELGVGRPALGIGLQEVDAELLEIGGDAGDDRAGGDRGCSLLHVHDRVRGGDEGEGADEREVEHHAERIGVGARVHRSAGGLLRGHVVGGADDRVLLVGGLRGDEAEVEDDDAALGVTRTLEGLMSRWTCPAACRAERPRASWRSAARSLVSSSWPGAGWRGGGGKVEPRTETAVEASRARAGVGTRRGPGGGVARSISVVGASRTWSTKGTPSTSSMVK